MAKVLVRLKHGHPNDTMRTRLKDDSVIEIPKTGKVIDDSNISREMEQCGWFEVQPVGKKKGQAAEPDDDENEQAETGAGKTETDDEESGQTPQGNGSTDDPGGKSDADGEQGSGASASGGRVSRTRKSSSGTKTSKSGGKKTATKTTAKKNK